MGLDRWIAGIAVLGACGGSPDPAPGNGCDPPRGPAFARFSDVTAASGLAFEYQSEDFKGGGLGVGDLDGDGLPDVIATRRMGGAAVFHNRGGMTFELVADSGIDPALAANALAIADLDNDGDLDVVLAATGEAFVFANQGDGRFVQAAHFTGTGRTEQVLATDLDGDGRLDIYFSNYDVVVAANAVNQLYVNRGGLQFDHRAVGTGMTWTTTAFDVDGDGDQDLYLANDTLLVDFGHPVATEPVTSTLPPDQLLRNDGPGSDAMPAFTDVAATVGLTTPRSSMGGTLGDFDGDGRFDLFVPNWGASKLFVRDASGGFVDRAVELGLAAIQRHDAVCGPDTDDDTCLLLSWSAALADFDLDGSDELLVINGITALGTSPPPVNLFVRGTDPTFHEVSPDIACIDGRGSVVTDLDGDGDPDVLIGPNQGPLVAYENRGTPRAGSWLRVVLHGTASNRDGIGAVVTVDQADGRSQRRVVGAGGVINSASPAEALFGLGDGGVADVVVDWPSGQRTMVAGPASGTVVVAEPALTSRTGS